MKTSLFHLSPQFGIVGVALFAFLAGCGGAGGGSNIGGDGTSGVRGQALQGPITPGPSRPGVPDTAPLSGAIITAQRNGGGQEVARTVADATGNFQLALRPGTYLLVPLPPQPKAILPRGTAQTVTVQTGTFTTLIVNYDTGLR